MNYENSKKRFSNYLSCDVAIVCAVDVEMDAVKKTFKDKRIERISFDNDEVTIIIWNLMEIIEK